MKLFSKIFLLGFITLNVCYAGSPADSLSFKVNKTHLDYLYEEINIGDNQMGIIHIYCDAPSYNFVDAKGEGYACVDDAARAGLFYLDYFKTYNDSASLHKFIMLVNFILHMQAKNGFFYNFLLNDNSINKTYRTSVAEPNWWSWRALWLLTEAYDNYKKTDLEQSTKTLNSINSCVDAIKQIIPEQRNKNVVEGINLPGWLPEGSGADQSALLLITLSNYFKISGDKSILNYIKILSKGIIMMQIHDSNLPLNGAFLSWENTWHAWGNSQAYALLKASEVIKDNNMKSSALKELDTFYPYLLKNKFLASFKVRKSGNTYKVIEENKYSQIAYDIRPMVFALLEAYKITGKIKYAEEAGKISKWFTGNNPANVAMYNVQNGLVFDGIPDQKTLNKNSGAESTVEALWTLLKVSKNTIALKYFLENNKTN